MFSHFSYMFLKMSHPRFSAARSENFTVYFCFVKSKASNDTYFLTRSIGSIFFFFYYKQETHCSQDSSFLLIFEVTFFPFFQLTNNGLGWQKPLVWTWIKTLKSFFLFFFNNICSILLYTHCHRLNMHIHAQENNFTWGQPSGFSSSTEEKIQTALHQMCMTVERSPQIRQTLKAANHLEPTRGQIRRVNWGLQHSRAPSHLHHSFTSVSPAFKLNETH